MDDITMRQFLFTQPDSEVEQATDKAYLAIANKLLCHWDKNAFFKRLRTILKK